MLDLFWNYRWRRAMLDLLFALLLVAVLLNIAAGSARAADAGTVVHGGDVLSNVVQWIATAFAAPAAALVCAVAYRALGWFGVQTTQAQRDQLQSIILNGINAASAKAQMQMRGNPKLDLNVQNQIVADAVAYAQAHASETITALGLDPASGEAVEVLRKRVLATIADPSQPTSPVANQIVEQKQ